MEDELSANVKNNSILHGRIDSQEKMYEIYKGAHVILLTSAFEGFPMVIKEGMACGCVPLVTALEGNKTHLTNRQNGLLIEAITEEEKVIEQGIKLIQELIGSPELVSTLSQNSYKYACQHFQKEHFLKECRKLLLQ
jgi:glycosyltransferase involved in cell wall biosynthesis